MKYRYFDKNEQKTPEFLVLNPNGRTPVIVGRENNDYVLSKSGAILLYLAECHGQLYPEAIEKCYEVMQWLMFQMNAVGPMMRQVMFLSAHCCAEGYRGWICDRALCQRIAQAIVYCE